MTKLYVTATPIGNLGDITLRAIETLKMCDFIICEDTRVTGKLLHHLEIETKMISLNAFDEKKNLESLVEKIKEVENIAVVSDAGTPGISDPGTRLVSLARENEVDIEVIPGVSALTAALSGSGFDTSKFTFLGFLPKKKGRKTLFESLPEIKQTIVFYESPHRIIKTLEELQKIIPERKIGVYKEITKIHEEFVKGLAQEVLDFFKNNEDKIKGEFVVIIDSVK
jgi:16S rRNA (cytidine1402-2'-O)-methyltransferase